MKTGIKMRFSPNYIFLHMRKWRTPRVKVQNVGPLATTISRCTQLLISALRGLTLDYLKGMSKLVALYVPTPCMNFQQLSIVSKSNV